MGNISNKQSRGSYTVYVLVCLTVVVILLRIVTGKYDEGYINIFLWAMAALVPLVYVVYVREEQLSRSNWAALIFYSTLVFIGCLLVQPLLWFFGKIGFIPFFTYSLLVLLPVEALILWPMIRKRPFVAATDPVAISDPSDYAQLNQEGLKAQTKLLIQKLNRIRQALAIETDPARQFQYQMQIEQMEKEIEELKEKLR